MTNKVATTGDRQNGRLEARRQSRTNGPRDFRDLTRAERREPGLRFPMCPGTGNDGLKKDFPTTGRTGDPDAEVGCSVDNAEKTCVVLGKRGGNKGDPRLHCLVYPLT